MPSTPSVLLHQLRQNNPGLTFVESTTFAWSPSDEAISYNPSDPNLSPLLLHELAHATLKHSDYQRDIELIAMERAAWDYAIGELGPTYSVVIQEDFADDALTTYRDWLHDRSTCPNCAATGLQTKPREYTCLACHHHWRVNEARVCALRRYDTKKTR